MMQRTNKILLGVAVGAVLFAIGRWSGSSGAEVEPRSHAGQESEAASSVWTCPMHPQIKLPDPGDCPICGMDLVPLSSGGEGEPRHMVMSPTAVALANITTEVVGRKNVTRSVRMAGKIDYDETAVRTISAWVPGRLDRLFVDYTGVRVAAGDHLVRLYSPDLLTAQEELLSARERLKATEGEASQFLATSNQRAYESARGKLLLWGLTEEQVAEIEKRGSATDHTLLTSPSSGVVIDKFLDEGAYVQTGTPVYRIADLGRLWVRLDAYEQDLPWLRLGQEVTLAVEALPGESFAGRISYIDPFIHERTRTAKVRVNLDNAAGRLKPGMFVRAVSLARLGAKGVVLDQHLAGKWVSPMHPEIVKDEPGACDVCGMDLVPAEELGLVAAAPADGDLPVVVPTTATLVTGKRAVVYVEVPGQERPTFEGREVVLGPRAGDEYIVLSGLEAGERIVVHGAFRIDSSMQILAKPSMMDMPADRSSSLAPEAHAFREELHPLYSAYLELQVALAGDDAAAASEAAVAAAEALTSIESAGAPGSLRATWGDEARRLRTALEALGQAEGLEALRDAFRPLSESLLVLAREFGNAEASELFEVFCPMAFGNEGASWLQAGSSVLNPYFGSDMLECGVVRATFSPAAPHAHGE